MLDRLNQKISDMVGGLFSFAYFDFNGFQDGFAAQNHEKDDVLTIKGSRQQEHLFGIQEIEEERTNLGVGNFCSAEGFFEDNFAKKSLHQETSFDELSFNFVFPENQCSTENPEKGNFTAATNNKHPSARPSWDLLNNYGTGFKKLKTTNRGEEDPEADPYCGRRKLSTEEIIRVAGARYIQFCDLRYDDFSMVMHPFGHALSGLYEEETKDVELVHLLLAATEKVGYQQFERACRLLSRCQYIASERSNPVQRIVYYLAEALMERMDKESGRINQASLKESKEVDLGVGTNLTFVTLYQMSPFLQPMHFAAVQMIVENVSAASKIHVVDFAIRSGVQWTIFMQAIAERDPNQIELLKLTAVGMAGKHKLEEVGKRLASVAESLKLRFSFRTVYLQDMNGLEEGMFEMGAGEFVVVYCPLILRTLIARPCCLENLMMVVKRLNPAIMVTVEVEANLNSPSFVGRFIETLFYYGAFFDCLETCTGQDDEVRTRAESILYGVIRNIVATEGPERVARSVKMEVWRAFFGRFRMVEIGVSDSSFYQANLVIRQFPWAEACALERNGKSVVVVWKGTPIHCVSAWRFPKERGRIFGSYKLI